MLCRLQEVAAALLYQYLAAHHLRQLLELQEPCRRAHQRKRQNPAPLPVLGCSPLEPLLLPRQAALRRAGGQRILPEA